MSGMAGRDSVGGRSGRDRWAEQSGAARLILVGDRRRRVCYGQRPRRRSPSMRRDDVVGRGPRPCRPERSAGSGVKSIGSKRKQVHLTLTRPSWTASLARSGSLDQPGDRIEASEQRVAPVREGLCVAALLTIPHQLALHVRLDRGGQDDRPRYPQRRNGGRDSFQFRLELRQHPSVPAVVPSTSGREALDIAERCCSTAGSVQ